MQSAKRVILVVLSFAFAIIYALPNLALLFAVGTVVISEWVSAVACFVFAYNTAKLVESTYRRYLDGSKENGSDVEQLDNSEQKEWIHGEGYSYYVEADEITFQFRNVKDHDGRQVSRLIFIRDKYFKDK